MADPFTPLRVGFFFFINWATPMNEIIIDTEVYKNYFLLAARQVHTGKQITIEMHNDDAPTMERGKVAALMKNNTTISFNGLSYDMPIIWAFVTGRTNSQIKALSDAIIKTNLPSWQVLKTKGVRVPDNWDHIDLIEVAPGKASLKIYGGRMGVQKMQDLPIEPDATISKNDAATLRAYCGNDLDVTLALFNKLQQQIALRRSMSEQYGIDLRSKSDAQIAEAVIKSEFTKITGETAYRPDIDQSVFHYQNPNIIHFETPVLRNVFERILNTEFTLAANGSIKLPDWLKDEPINVGGVNFQMGIGGLHSCEKSQLIDVEGTDRQLADYDVASYYPNIILQQKLSPHSMGEPFLKVYQSIVERRLEAKRAGDTVTADTLKICVNGSFGKLGSKWSALYSPELLIQTTITGQLALLMLIERCQSRGIDVVSANTDGVVTYCHKSLDPVLREVAFDWMLDTSYELERTEYLRLASANVNNYVAVKTDRSFKGKGVFAPTGLMKNPDAPIIADAVALFISKGIPIDKTITECTDVRRFCIVRRVNGGAVWCGRYLGKAVRFYYSTKVESHIQIEYQKNSNKVPKSDGSKPLMDLPETMPDDVDFDRYINAAEKLLLDVGYA